MTVIDLIAAARPNFMKVAPLYKALKQADLLWTPSPDADENLLKEGVPRERIHCVGNIMIGSLEMMRPAIEARRYAHKLKLEKRSFGVVTLHRPSNVDEPARLRRLVDLLAAAAARFPVVFPVHPRTRRRLEETKLLATLQGTHGIHLAEPLGYTDFMSLVFDCGYALTDSGGIQEETTYLGIPCITLRDNTERPITVTQGTNELAKLEDVPRLVDRILTGQWKKGRAPQLWDGRTADRVLESLKRRAPAQSRSRSR